jgi:hypothetical protein
MFKKLATFAVAAMLTLSASSAFAAFADLELFRVVYERTTGTTEQVTDLGNVNTIVANGTGTFAGPALSATNNANLYVAYFAVNRLANTFWVSGSTNTALKPVAVGAAGFNSTKNGSNNFYSYYNTLTPSNGVYTGQQSNLNSYISALGNAMGNDVNIATRANTEASLASIVGVAGASVTQYLYIFNGTATTGNGASTFTNIALHTNSDGSTTVTPIPAAFYLMGSGLMGLVGLRRRNKVA